MLRFPIWHAVIISLIRNVFYLEYSKYRFPQDLMVASGTNANVVPII